MAKKIVISDEDIKTFQEAVQGTLPLAEGKVRLRKKRVKPVRPLPDLNDEPSYLGGGEPQVIVQADDYITYKQESISNKILRNLSKGQYNVEAVLDLHRKTIDEARGAINYFLETCLKRGSRCVIIVHGKGKLGTPPALKNQINHWLRQVSPVLAFCSALPRHGGNGAIYVLLKNNTKE